MIDVKTSSPASLAFQSIATVVGIATIHAFVVGAGIRRKKTDDPSVGKKNKGQSPLHDDGFTNEFIAEDSKEEEEDANDQYVAFRIQIVSSLYCKRCFCSK